MKVLPIETLQPNVSVRSLTVLNRVMDGITRGSSEDIRTPFLSKLSTIELQEKFHSLMDKWDLTPTLRKIEESNLEKVGPRSIAKPWAERREDTYKYFDHQLSDDPIYSLLRLSNGRLIPLDFNKAKEHLWNSTNSGLPFMIKKGLVKPTLNESDSSQRLKLNLPAVLFTRTQEMGKTRDVWGYPIDDTLLEQRYYQPLLALRRRLPQRAALNGPDEVDKSITVLMRRFGGKKVSLDFSGYDRTFGLSLQFYSWSYIASKFQAKYGHEISDIATRFQRVGLVTPDGIIQGPHGVPSGSTFTNEVDSIGQEYASALAVDTNPKSLLSDWFKSDKLYIPYAFQVQGDDGVYDTDAIQVKDPDVLFSRFESQGLKPNWDKSHVASDEIIYLQRYYHEKYRSLDRNDILGGVYSAMRALNRITHMERWTDISKAEITGQDYFSIRAISILENCKHHPYFRDIIKFISREGDLNYSKEAIPAYIRMVESKSGGLKHQYSDQVKDINSFATVKLLKEIG